MVVRTPLESLTYCNYSEDLLDKQYEFVRRVTEHWIGFDYTNKRWLKEAYSKKSFTPDTRHYAFEGDRLVGFVSSAIKKLENGTVIGTLQRPFIENEDPEIEGWLMDKTLNKLKELGATRVVTPLMKYWGNADEFIQKYNFKESKCDPSYKTAVIDFRSIDLSDFEVPEYILEVDPVADKEELIRVFVPELPNLTAEQIGETIDTWPTAENIVINAIMKDDLERVLAHGMIKKSADGKHAYMPHISIYGSMNPLYRESLFKFLILKLQETNAEKLYFNLSSMFFNTTGQYESFGIEFSEIMEYEKEL